MIALDSYPLSFTIEIINNEFNKLCAKWLSLIITIAREEELPMEINAKVFFCYFFLCQGEIKMPFIILVNRL